MTKRLALLCLLACALAWPARARASSAILSNARNTFEYGNYEESGRLAETLLASHELTEERDLVEAYKIAGLSQFYLNHPEAARRHFVALLSVDPDYAMDPFLVPPAAVAFFDGVKKDNESLLAPIRERRKALAEQERLAEEARRKLLEDNLLHQLEPERPVLVKTVEVHTFGTNFVPFGAGQFQENRPAMGVVFAGTQVAGLATAVISFIAIENLRDSYGRYYAADYGTAQSFATAKWAGVTVFGASVALGIADSLWHYEATTSHIEALQQPQSKPSKPSEPTPAPPSKPQSFKPTLVPWATPNAGGLAMGLKF